MLETNWLKRASSTKLWHQFLQSRDLALGRECAGNNSAGGLEGNSLELNNTALFGSLGRAHYRIGDFSVARALYQNTIMRSDITLAVEAVLRQASIAKVS